MIRKICENHPMDSDYDNGRILTNQGSFPGRNKQIKLKSWEISWDGAAGTLDGTINIYASNSGHSESRIQSINVGSASNTDDCVLDAPIVDSEFIRFEYTAHSITAGTLNIVLFYDSINP